MSRLIALLAFFVLGLPGTIATTARAQPACTFTRGFAVLRDLIRAQYGDIVGECLEDEHFDPETGNMLQRTAGGLMVWRKADNWTAFTDGNLTYLNGPTGLAVRPNTAPRFSWETSPPVQQTEATGAPAIAQQPAGPRVEVEQYTTYRSGSSLRVVGILVNHGDLDASDIRIAVSLVGDDGAVVAADSASVKPDRLEAGARAPWSAFIWDAPRYREVTIQVQAKPVTRYSAENILHTFRADGVSVRGSRDIEPVRVSGRAVNTGQDTSTSVRVIVAVFDGDRVADVRDSYVRLDEIPPGQSAPFEVSFYGGPSLKNPSRVEIFVEGRKKG